MKAHGVGKHLRALCIDVCSICLSLDSGVYSTES